MSPKAALFLDQLFSMSEFEILGHTYKQKLAFG